MAEELATIDLISKGRLVTGWVRGAGSRAVLQQRQPRLQPGDVRRGPRLHRAGLDPARSVALRGQALPLPPREPVGAALPEAAPADVDPRRAQPRDRAVVRRAQLPLPRSGHRPRARPPTCGTCTPTRRPSTATRPVRRTSATCCPRSWPTPRRRPRSWARASSSAAGRTPSPAPSTRCPRATTPGPPSSAWPRRPGGTWLGRQPREAHGAAGRWRRRGRPTSTRSRQKLAAGYQKAQSNYQLMIGTPDQVVAKLRDDAAGHAAGHVHLLRPPGPGRGRGPAPQPGAAGEVRDARDQGLRRRASAWAAPSSCRPARTSCGRASPARRSSTARRWPSSACAERPDRRADRTVPPAATHPR